MYWSKCSDLCQRAQLKQRRSTQEISLPGEVEEGLIKVEAVLEALEALLLLGVAERLVVLHLAIAVEIGPSLFI